MPGSLQVSHNETPEAVAHRRGADGKSYRATRPRQAIAAGPVGDSASTSVLEAVETLPVSERGVVLVSGVSSETPETIARRPDRDEPRPIVTRPTLFSAPEKGTSEGFTTIARKPGQGDRGMGGEVMTVPTDPTELANALFERYGSRGIIALVALLQVMVHRGAKRVMPDLRQIALEFTNGSLPRWFQACPPNPLAKPPRCARGQDALQQQPRGALLEIIGVGISPTGCGTVMTIAVSPWIARGPQVNPPARLA